MYERVHTPVLRPDLASISADSALHATAMSIDEAAGGARAVRPVRRLSPSAA